MLRGWSLSFEIDLSLGHHFSLSTGILWQYFKATNGWLPSLALATTLLPYFVLLYNVNKPNSFHLWATSLSQSGPWSHPLRPPWAHCPLLWQGVPSYPRPCNALRKVNVCKYPDIWRIVSIILPLGWFIMQSFIPPFLRIPLKGGLLHLSSIYGDFWVGL